jgi:hypothetical protein
MSTLSYLFTLVQIHMTDWPDDVLRLVLTCAIVSRAIQLLRSKYRISSQTTFQYQTVILKRFSNDTPPIYPQMLITMLIIALLSETCGLAFCSTGPPNRSMFMSHRHNPPLWRVLPVCGRVPLCACRSINSCCSVLIACNARLINVGGSPQSRSGFGGLAISATRAATSRSGETQNYVGR